MGKGLHRTALLAASLAALAAGPAVAQEINVLAIGQSNMEGLFGPAQFTDADPAISVWDIRSQRFRTAQLGEFPFFRSRGETTPANNLAYVFARTLAEKCSVNVNLTLLAAGGMRIEYFLPIDVLARHGWANTQVSSRYGDSLADEIFSPRGAASEALRATGAWRYDVVLVHQGEANAGRDDAETYAAKLGSLISELARRGLTDPHLPVIVGTVNTTYDKGGEHAKALTTFVSDHIAVADWTGIETYAETTGTGQMWHATGKGLQELGTLYFDAYWSVIGGACPTFRSAESPPVQTVK